MKRVIYLLLLVLLNMGACTRGMAFSTTEPFTWEGGSNNGAPAGACKISWDDVNPFAVPRTVVVNNDMPDGTVLASWSYGEFIGGNGVTLNCTTSGIHNSLSTTRFSDTGERIGFFPDIVGLFSYMPIELNGLALHIYAQYTTSEIPCPGECGGYAGNNWLTFVSHRGTAPFTEVDVSGMVKMEMALSAVPVQYGFADLAMAPAYGQFQYRAELVKSGTVNASDSGKKIGLMGYFHVYDFWNTKRLDEFLFTNPDTNVTVVVSSCQLKTKDYTIPMGSWGIRPASVLPARGSETPINIALKCDDEVPHVRFRFEDTGSSLLGNHNVSLYTAEGGEKVDGMEIEILYNGAHVDIDNTTLVDTGAQGTAGAVAAESTASFTARYVQLSEITRNGNTYVGPVTGKVNMWMTYD